MFSLKTPLPASLFNQSGFIRLVAYLNFTQTKFESFFRRSFVVFTRRIAQAI